MGIRMLTLDTKTSLYSEDRGFQVPMTLDHDKHIVRPDPRVRQRISSEIGTIRPIRVDHTDFFKWILKLFNSIWFRKNSMDLCTYEREEREHGVGPGVNTTLVSDTL
jgi:hypothetical protein